MARVKVVFAGWAVNGRLVDIPKKDDGSSYRPHEGAAVKRLLKAKRLSPRYSRA